LNFFAVMDCTAFNGCEFQQAKHRTTRPPQGVRLGGAGRQAGGEGEGEEVKTGNVL
jgi:hypothetical protein